MVNYEDLLSIPYEDGGRDPKKGLDCYGLLLELCRRNGKPLKDIYSKGRVKGERLPDLKETVNIMPIDKHSVKYGDVMYCLVDHNLHVGFMLDNKTVLHMTDRGARLTPCLCFVNPQFCKVI